VTVSLVALSCVSYANTLVCCLLGALVLHNNNFTGPISTNIGRLTKLDIVNNKDYCVNMCNGKTSQVSLLTVGSPFQ
jgi:hypothetical protein